MQRLHLLAASDDYLLELSLRRLIDDISSHLGVGEAQRLSPEISPEDLAVEICTPSLFDPQRVLVVEDVRAWLDAPAPVDAPKVQGATDVSPLVRTLEDGVPEGVAVVLGAWCGRKPKGELVAAIEAGGAFRWIPLPAAPKPWENVSLSEEQRQVLHNVLVAHAAGKSFDRRAEALLLERLGFAPRLLAAEVEKLVAGAGERPGIDEELVRQLTFPRERSLEVVRDAVLDRDPAKLLDLVAAASAGVPVRDWQGRRVDPGGLPVILLSQISNLLEQLLYLRRLATRLLPDELDPRRTGAHGWYGRVFKGRIAPVLEREISTAGPSPVSRKGKAPSPWTMGQLFEAATRYPDELLVAALTAAGPLEQRLRGGSALDALSAWLSMFVETPQG